jgi:hypothetical protein
VGGGRLLQCERLPDHRSQLTDCRGRERAAGQFGELVAPQLDRLDAGDRCAPLAHLRRIEGGERAVVGGVG